MATEVLKRRGTTAEHATFTGGAGEITVDTDKNTAVVHDGSTAGGHPLAKTSDLANVGGGAWELLSSVSASGASSVDMNITDINAGASSDDYISFVVFGIGDATSAPNFDFRLKEFGSVVNSSGAYYTGSAGRNYMQRYNLDRNWTFTFQVMGPQSGLRASVIAGEYDSYRTTGGGTTRLQSNNGSFGGATRMSGNATDGINITVSTGTIDGEIRLYGVKYA